MTARAKKVIEELAQLSPTELSEVLQKFTGQTTTNEDGRRVCRNADLLRFIDGHAPDPEFADDIEAGVRERRSRADQRTSPWDR